MVGKSVLRNLRIDLQSLNQFQSRSGAGLVEPTRTGGASGADLHAAGLDEEVAAAWAHGSMEPGPPKPGPPSEALGSAAAVGVSEAFPL